MKSMPQEIQVWYVLPALRKEFAKCLCNDFGKTQKEAAELLGVTGAAISQYFKSKRASGVKFPEGVLREVKKSCSKIINEEASVAEEMYRISVSEDAKKAMCRIHREEDDSVGEECNICFRYEEKW